MMGTRGKLWASIQKMSPGKFLLLSLTLSFIVILSFSNLLGISCSFANGPNTATTLPSFFYGLGYRSNVSDTTNEVTLGSRADWGSDVFKSHPYCRTLIANPLRASTPLCKRDIDMTCMNGKQKGLIPMFSQVGQDHYVYTRHFKNLARPGVYVEAGTRHPVMGSNTFFLDSCLRWKGACVEANPDTMPSIHRVRSCELVPTCVTEVDKAQKVFLMGDESGGIDDTNKNKKDFNNSVRQVSLTCMSLQKILDRRNVKVLDYLSLDVEGHELDVLKGLDHSRTIINVMTIETTDESLREIQPYLESVGYSRHIPDLDENSKRTGLLRRDAVFVHRSVHWGYPL